MLNVTFLLILGSLLGVTYPFWKFWNWQADRQATKAEAKLNKLGYSGDLVENSRGYHSTAIREDDLSKNVLVIRKITPLLYSTLLVLLSGIAYGLYEFAQFVYALLQSSPFGG